MSIRESSRRNMVSEECWCILDLDCPLVKVFTGFSSLHIQELSLAHLNRTSVRQFSFQQDVPTKLEFEGQAWKQLPTCPVPYSAMFNVFTLPICNRAVMCKGCTWLCFSGKYAGVHQIDKRISSASEGS
jgi:hypothetical protein